MENKNDLFYLATIILLNGEIAKNGLSYIKDYDISMAIDLANKLYNKIYDNKEKMILE